MASPSTYKLTHQTLDPANGARAATDKVLLVQNLDAAGAAPTWSDLTDIKTAAEASTVSLALIDNIITVDDAVSGTTGALIGGLAKSAQKAAVADDDFSLFVSNLYGELVGAGHTWATNSNRSEEINPIHLAPVSESLLDDTNVAAATNYYPSTKGVDMFGFKDLSVTGEFVDADGTITMTVEGTNDEDLSTGVWIDITKVGLRTDLNTTSLINLTVTNGTISFGFDHDNVNYNNVRYKIINDGATNAMSLKMRRKAV